MTRKKSLPIVNRLKQVGTTSPGIQAVKRAQPTRSTVRRQLKTRLTGRSKRG